MNRRHFLGQIALGSAAVATTFRTPLSASPSKSGLTVKFVGMMGYIERTDKSMLVALPGHQAMHHLSHVPFLMARAGSPIAKALGLKPMAGVVAEAFDADLAGNRSDAFVYRCLDATDIEIAGSNRSAVEVDNQASHLAQMHLIAPGKRLRGNLLRWANTTVSLKGGTLVNAAAHPDAGKTWSFGSHKQPLSDAAAFHASDATIRVGVAGAVDTFAADGASSELWVVSAAGARSEASDPRRLDHGDVVFEYLNDSKPVVAYCAEAEGRMVATDLPCAPGTLASRSGGAAAIAPPFLELCYGAFFRDAQ
ncbi:MAG TPA: hypothetical protein VNJ02_15455 [Vicinamibacterales bacterium]|nr:hypothetical protein [Vicinamibacterales bacterium]